MEPTGEINSSPLGAAAAASAITTGTAAAILGTLQAETAFTLTSKSLQESEAPLVFPLILLSGAAIAEGFAAYLATQERAKGADATAVNVFNAATDHLRDHS